jgi:hypothetical protein
MGCQDRKQLPRGRVVDLLQSLGSFVPTEHEPNRWESTPQRPFGCLYAILFREWNREIREANRTVFRHRESLLKILFELYPRKLLIRIDDDDDVFEDIAARIEDTEWYHFTSCDWGAECYRRFDILSSWELLAMSEDKPPEDLELLTNERNVTPRQLNNCGVDVCILASIDSTDWDVIVAAEGGS